MFNFTFNQLIDKFDYLLLLIFTTLKCIILMMYIIRDTIRVNSTQCHFSPQKINVLVLGALLHLVKRCHID